LFAAHPQPSSVRNLRIVLLFPLEFQRLTVAETRGNKSPRITAVLDAWKSAFKSIPVTVQLIKVDINHSFEFGTLLTAGLAGHLSTYIHMKSKIKSMKTEFMVIGPWDEKKFVEGTMVGLWVGSKEIDAAEGVDAKCVVCVGGKGCNGGCKYTNVNTEM
jgi:hypothetical protein